MRRIDVQQCCARFAGEERQRAVNELDRDRHLMGQQQRGQLAVTSLTPARAPPCTQSVLPPCHPPLNFQASAAFWFFLLYYTVVSSCLGY